MESIHRHVHTGPSIKSELVPGATPSVETCLVPPGPGNGATYTSLRRDSSDEYAIQCPSGENVSEALRALSMNFHGFLSAEVPSGSARIQSSPPIPVSSS